MKSARCVKVAFLFMALAIFAGCDSKKDKQAENAASPNDKSVSSAAAPQGEAGAQLAEADKTDARAEADRVLAQLRAGEYQAIYQQAAPGFKEIGTEPQFVAMMQQTRQKTGAMQGSKQTLAETGPDKRQVLNYSVQYDNVKSKLRLSFMRSKSGKMELVGLNQKDDVVKNPKKDVVKK